MNYKEYWYHDLDTCISETSPLRMVDRLRVSEDFTTAQARKAVSMNEAFFQGHFPGQPIMPGVLQVGAMAQTSAAIVRHIENISCDTSFVKLQKIENLKFRNPVQPGDVLFVETALEESEDGVYTFQASISANGNKACEGKLKITTFELSQLTQARSEILPDTEATQEQDNSSAALDINGVMQAIPHRFPMLLVDKVLLLDSNNDRIIGHKNITGDEPYFAGTAAPLVPGYLQVEMAAQTGCTLAMSKPGNEGKVVYFMAIDEAEFLQPALPGDSLSIDINVSGKGRFGKATGSISVAEMTVTQFSIKFAVVDTETSS